MGGKKDKKKKGTGAIKTAAKTEKKQELKRKKELADLGEVCFCVVYISFID